MKPANTLTLKGLLGISAISAVCLLAACGGGGGGGGGSSNSGSSSAASSSSSSASSISVSSYSSSANTAMLTVDSTFGTVNPLYTTVKICAPGSTTNCKTVDHVLVDTGSTGLRLMASALNTTVINALGVRSSNNLPVQECMLFGTGHTWGAIKLADFTIGEKTVSSLPIQVIQDGSYTEPTLCSNTGTSYISASPVAGATSAQAALGANGILGIGAGLQDCGTLCTTVSKSVYMTCSTSNSASCAQIALATDQQLPNPVSQFAADNNGVVISLPAVSADTGANTVTGTLIFGIDTRTNNQSSAVTVYGTDSYGFLSQASYNSTTYGTTIIDSGSNAYFFADSSIKRCTDTSGNTLAWYCPAQALPISAAITSVLTTIPAKTKAITFSVANAAPLFNSGRTAFNNIGATSGSGDFIFGLPFFYGRNVYVAFDTKTTSSGTGPYVGF
jgi:hypothetical protein